MLSLRRSAISMKKRSRNSAGQRRARNEAGRLLYLHRVPLECVRRREASGSPYVDARAGQRGKGGIRPAATSETIRTVFLQRVRSARPLQAAQGRAAPGGEQNRA